MAKTRNTGGGGNSKGTKGTKGRAKEIRGGKSSGGAMPGYKMTGETVHSVGKRGKKKTVTRSYQPSPREKGKQGYSWTGTVKTKSGGKPGFRATKSAPRVNPKTKKVSKRTYGKKSK